MIKFDNKVLEDILCDLFIESLSVKNYKLRKIEDKKNFFIELFLYIHFYNNHCSIHSDVIDDEINSICKNEYKLNLNRIRNLLNLITHYSSNDRIKVTPHGAKFYKDLEKCFNRKLKIKNLLK